MCDSNNNNTSKDNTDLKEELKELALSKRLCFLIGSGASSPAIPLMSSFKSDDTEIANEKLLDKVKSVSRYLISQNKKEKSNKEKINNVLKSYKDLITSISNILTKSNSRNSPNEATIFTTNYDLFIEKALDEILPQTPLIFNDGAKGYFNRYLDGSNFNKTVSYRGLNDNYIDELPSISLIKPHGSVNWKKRKNQILVTNKVEPQPVVVKPTGYEDQETFLNNHFHDMLRIFQLELDKPQTVLFVIGFSFQDQHISQMIRRALNNRELIIECLCYSENDEKTILKNLKIKDNPINNLHMIKPNDLGLEKITLSDLCNILS